MTTPTYIREVDINEFDYGPVIACIEKNQSKDVRIRLCERKGQMYVDVRVFTEIKGHDVRYPTTKGLMLNVQRLPELVDGLLSAERDWCGRPD